MKPSSATISVPISVVQSTSEVQQLAGLANACGSQGVVKGEDVRYTVFNHLLPANLVGMIQALAPYGVEMSGYDADVYDTHPRHVRYIAVKDLSDDLPASIPSSSVTEEDESERQLTWQEVQDKPTVNVTPVDGIYYFNVTAHISFRSLSNIELAGLDTLTLLSQKEVPVVTESVE